ncbi:MAG: TatD family hydrolase [Candidatus Pacebacteria bacterium]|nr:TatD family hydrolase [Candidatus Paceibacterota bacterium]PIR60467.1 MAG: hypothetical protein COU67_01690 [Candidatus Pacebacteria bacterium CG10_big_fil_rev_8_21_14_0_10_44_54]
MIIDTHCHYNLEPLFSSWQTHWNKAQTAGVLATIIVGTNLESSNIAYKLAKDNKAFFATIGLHPNHFQTMKQLEEIAKLEPLIADTSVVAIGEIGLDFFRLTDSPSDQQIKELQKQGFRLQLELAARYNLPVCLHVRDKQAEAYFAVLEIIKSVERNQLPFILHCISGPTEYIAEALTLGAYLGVAANSTYPNNHAIRSSLAKSPNNRILLETDAPYLPPQPYRGQVCEPWMITETAKALFSQKKISANQILNNTKAAFLDKITI